MIAIYVSSHGFGHMSRIVAILEYLLNWDQEIYLVCGKEQIKYAKDIFCNYEQKIVYKELLTDIGLMNLENELEYNKEITEKALFNFISKASEVIDSEVSFLSGKDLRCIITDISPIGPLAAKKLNVPCLGISNFTWYDQYEYLGFDKKILNFFLEAYLLIDKFYQYPLSIFNYKKYFINEIKNIGFVARKIDPIKISGIKKKYGKYIYLSFGKSIKKDNFKITGTIPVLSNISIKGIKLIPQTSSDFHNYVAASSLVIAKAGWSTVSEALIYSRKLVLIERKNNFEDAQIIELLKKENLAVSISEEELNELNTDEILKIADKFIDIKKLDRIYNDSERIALLLKEFLEKQR